MINRLKLKKTNMCLNITNCDNLIYLKEGITIFTLTT